MKRKQIHTLTHNEWHDDEIAESTARSQTTNGHGTQRLQERGHRAAVLSLLHTQTHKLTYSQKWNDSIPHQHPRTDPKSLPLKSSDEASVVRPVCYPGRGRLQFHRMQWKYSFNFLKHGQPLPFKKFPFCWCWCSLARNSGPGLINFGYTDMGGCVGVLLNIRHFL